MDADIRAKLSFVECCAIEFNELIIPGGATWMIYAEWGRFCLSCRQVTETAEFSSAHFDLFPFDGVTEIRMAVDFSGGKLMIGTLFFVPYYEIDPLPITFHYDEAVASLREGYCLLVPISVDTDWSDAVWPKTMAELDSYIANSTGYPRLLEDWILGRRREIHKLLMVVLVKDDNCYGYLIGSPKDGDFNDTRIVPIFFARLEEFSFEHRVLIDLTLSVKQLQVLIRHSRQLQPSSGDVKEVQRLRYALDKLASALEKGVSRSRLP